MNEFCGEYECPICRKINIPIRCCRCDIFLDPDDDRTRCFIVGIRKQKNRNVWDIINPRPEMFKEMNINTGKILTKKDKYKINNNYRVCLTCSEYKHMYSNCITSLRKQFK
jgi:hypothetical protein